jgi:L-fuculose-phosphate aldolase
VDEADARRALVAAARRLDESGLNHNATGNLSVRIGRGILVTPTGIAAPALEPDDCVTLAPDGTPLDAGARLPTSEWQLHVALYGRADVGAVVHTHSIEAASAAALGRPVPAVHYVVARFGGSTLPCAPYATYGSAELAESVSATLGTSGMACLMANHGAVAVGGTLAAASSLAADVEWLCGVWRRGRQLGTPEILDDDEIARVRERLRTYGQPSG